MSWKDRLIMKVMGNKVVIKVFSIPIVLKLMMWQAGVFMSIVSLFKRNRQTAD